MAALVLCWAPRSLLAAAGQRHEDSPPLADPPASGQLDRTDEGHMHGKVPPRLPPPGAFDRLPALDESKWVVLGVRNQPYWKAGTFDPVLSNACAQGDFVTPTTNRLVVRFTARDGSAYLQAVPPAHHPYLLYDPRKLAKPTETYLFFSTNNPNCRVWIDGRAVARRLDPVRGTSNPKPDPRGLAKRQAEIKSWHSRNDGPAGASAPGTTAAAGSPPGTGR